ncbi:hypothetical protein DFQ28_007701 [Apophysomyces sp. BC1034]|nr:hypothetical protein DFQ30_009421 [Apophysomyces sp. BC1015]KAG0176110.1 hypothetical protein DFQ29_006526 [Apophysomyces sp. BC1021]KAG0186497.1 hypothetical protein DFQ28_007701 [Apophysomyces sp. BC1034]
MFGKSAFGGGGAFGQQQQQQQTPVFGQPQQQPQQQQPSAFGGFGATSTPSAFGAANTATGAFGQPPQPSAFGSTATTGGFGATAGSAFGQQSRPSAFGGTSAFGSTPTQTASTGFGGFGAATSTPSAFGAGTTQPGGGLFGQRPATSTAFGNTAAPGTGAFGQQQQTTAFGSMGATAGFGQPTGTNQGTATADFAPTQDRDATTGVTTFFQTITAMPQYKQFSLEELRLQDYTQNRKTAANTVAPGGFGAQPATGGFGASSMSTPFGQSATATPFGQQQQTTGAFGQPQATTGAFGSATGGGSLFGQQQQQPGTGTTAFGAPSTATGGFGSTAFGGVSSTPAFGAAATGGFGAAANTANKPFSFGSTASTTQPAAGGFGAAATTPAFGQPAAGATGFGQPAQQQTGFGGFGQKPAGATTTPGFGTGFGTGFGSAAASKPATSFSFGATSAAPSATTGATGFGGFGATTTGATGFGAAQTSQPGGLFGANKPAATTSLFGNTQQQSAVPSFGFGGGQQSTGFGAGGGMFGQKPTATATGTTSLFGNTQLGGTASTGGFGQTAQGTGAFTLPAQGGMTSFGISGLPLGQQQQPLVASVDKNPYGSNALFDTLNPAGTANKPEPSAVAIANPVKKTVAPHYPMSPRAVSKIKLRGFTFSPVSKSATKKTGSLDGISDDAVLGEGAFTPRPSCKKLVIDGSINKANITAIVNKSSEKPKILFDPKLELLAAKEHKPVTISNTRSVGNQERSASSDKNNATHHPSLVPVAVKEGYYCSPTLEVLSTMSKEDLKRVEKFVVGRHGYGEVRFIEPVDLSDLDLNDIMGGIVVFEEKSIVIYPDNAKPPEGKGLNALAIVKLENCYSIDKDTKKPIKDPEHPRFKLFLQKLRKREGVEFVDYDVTKGIWTFKARRF